MNEQWKPVVGYEGIYEVSDCGSVRSLHRYGALKTDFLRIQRWRVLSQTKSTKGYWQVHLHDKAGNKKPWTAFVHRLVAFAFLPPDPAGRHMVNHINGNREDNRVQNLEWTTRAENTAHAGHLGLMRRGERHHKSRLTSENVIEMRSLHSLGWSYAKLAEKFNVAKPTIASVFSGQTWGHVMEGRK